MNPAAALDWSSIDTVLLDMDGTLLDLNFDTRFWQQAVPRHFAAAHGLGLADAEAILRPKFQAVAGTLRWYCIEYWSEELGLDIAALKRAVLPQIAYLPGAEAFLARLRGLGKRTVLVTNAHPTTFALKNERIGLAAHLDACYSTHPFRAPKEDAAFWPRLQAREAFAPDRTLFVDDSLPVLGAARRFGIGWLRAVSRPDSQRAPQDTGEFVAVEGVADLL